MKVVSCWLLGNYQGCHEVSVLIRACHRFDLKYLSHLKTGLSGGLQGVVVFCLGGDLLWMLPSSPTVKVLMASWALAVFEGRTGGLLEEEVLSTTTTLLMSLLSRGGEEVEEVGSVVVGMTPKTGLLSSLVSFDCSSAAVESSLTKLSSGGVPVGLSSGLAERNSSSTEIGDRPVANSHKTRVSL